MDDEVERTLKEVLSMILHGVTEKTTNVIRMVGVPAEIRT
jgi:hypothetical protein